MKTLKIITVIIILALIMTILFVQRHAMACGSISLTEYKQITENIYASPTIKDAKLLISTISNGKNRVINTFGEMRANPRIILVNDISEAKRFGANLTGSAILTPFGSCVVLGPKGQNTDVAAHELVHAEVYQRTGWYAHWQEIPIWFNEGVALIVDHRTPFLVTNINLAEEQVTNVKQLITSRQFFTGTNVQQNYLASRLAVDPINVSHLYKNLERIKNGEHFESVFDTLK